MAPHAVSASLPPTLWGRRAGLVEEALVNAARALTSLLDADGVCTALLDAVDSVFSARSSWVLLYDPGLKQLRTVCSRGLAGEAFRGLAIAPDVGTFGLAFTTCKVVFVPNANDDARWREVPHVSTVPLQAVFIVPLVYGGEALGVVGLDSPHFGAQCLPSEADIEPLEALAAQAAVAIANARLYHASEEDRRRLQSLLQERHRLRHQVIHLEEDIKAVGAFKDIVGQSPAIREALKQAALAAPGATTILLLGETGSGKELFARFIHERSGRAKGPFVPVNCAALPEALVESELFGHERGAFTGAVARKAGKFEIAHHGTVFLDEIGDLPQEAQAKLLRVLQDYEVQPVGSTHALPVDVRVVAATNKDLERAIGTRAFRADLYYRLSVFPIRIPSLRERCEDIPALARYFAAHFATTRRKRIDGLTPAALQQLQSYDWPGNIRELQNVLERAVILTEGSVIDVDAIIIRAEARHLSCAHRRADVVSFAEAEQRAIIAALDAAGWRVSGTGGAADLLALKATTLHAKMKKLDIRRPSSQEPCGQ